MPHSHSHRVRALTSTLTHTCAHSGARIPAQGGLPGTELPPAAVVTERIWVTAVGPPLQSRRGPWLDGQAGGTRPGSPDPPSHLCLPVPVGRGGGEGPWSRGIRLPGTDVPVRLSQGPCVSLSWGRDMCQVCPRRQACHVPTTPSAPQGFRVEGQAGPAKKTPCTLMGGREPHP